MTAMWAEAVNRVHLHNISDCNAHVSQYAREMFKLVCVVIALCYTFSAIAAEDPDEAAAKDAVMKCQDELKMSDEKLKELHSNKMMVKDPNDEEGRCFIKCMMEKFQLIDDNERINMEGVMNNSKDVIESMKKKGKPVSEQSLRKTLEECSNEGSDVQGKCARSDMIWKCLRAKMEEVSDGAVMNIDDIPIITEEDLMTDVELQTNISIDISDIPLPSSAAIGN